MNSCCPVNDADVSPATNMLLTFENTLEPVMDISNRSILHRFPTVPPTYSIPLMFALPICENGALPVTEDRKILGQLATSNADRPLAVNP